MLEINLTAFLLYIAKKERHSAGIAKYFVVQRLGSLWLLLGGRMALGGARFSGIGGLFLRGLVLKLGIVPLHTWLIRLMEELRWDTIILLASLQKVVPLILLFKSNFTPLLSVLVLSALGGTWGLFGQKRAKLFIAYFSLLRSAWLLLGVSSPSIRGVYLIGFTLRLILWGKRFAQRRSEAQAEANLRDNSWQGRGRASLAGLTLRGFPPTVGFFTKLVILLQACVLSLYGQVGILLALSPLILYSVLEFILQFWKLQVRSGWEKEFSETWCWRSGRALILLAGGGVLVLLWSKRA